MAELSTSQWAEGVRDEPRGQAALVGKLAFGATAVFTTQLYLSTAQWLPFLEPFRPALLLSTLSLSALIAYRLLGNRPLFLGWRSVFLGLYTGWAVMSVTWSLNPALSKEGAAEVLKHFLFFVALVNTANNPSRIRTIILLLAAAACVPGWGTFSNWWHGELLVEGFRGRWLGVMADPNHDAMALVAAVPLGLFLLTSGPTLKRRVVGLACVVLCIMGVVATHSRGGSVGLAVSVALFALMSRRKALAMSVAVVVALTVAVLAPKSFWERNETIATYEEDASVQGRMQAWQVAFRIAHERPFTGVGVQAFLDGWGPYAAIDAGAHRYVAHNLFLEVLGELGYPGLVGLVGLLLASFVSTFLARHGPLGAESRAVFAALGGYMVCQQFSGYSLSWFLTVLCGLAACCWWYGRPGKAPVVEAT